ncbi:MAG: radical SAM protein [Candidatus Omnitrophica bacterium]|nr:radical SAM protein [Candidatus Omnitrophota bacterium]
MLRFGCQGLKVHSINYFSKYLQGRLMSLPQAVDIYPTFRCNLRCKYCYCWKYKNYDSELSLNQWKSIILKLRKWLGFFSLRICGAEPFMRKDILDIIRFANENEVFTVLTTNATLINDSIAKLISKSGLDFIAISLESLNESVHDYLRGVDGTCRKVIKAIDLLKSRVGKIQINTIILDRNLEDIPDLVEYCDKKGMSISFQGFQDERLDICDIQNGLWPKDMNKRIGTFDRLLEMKRNGYSISNSEEQLRIFKNYYVNPDIFKNTSDNCFAYARNFRINPNGDVIFCPYFNIAGNVSSKDPKEIWISYKASDIREKMRLCKTNCSFIRSHYYENIIEKFRKFQDVFFR